MYAVVFNFIIHVCSSVVLEFMNSLLNFIWNSSRNCSFVTYFIVYLGCKVIKLDGCSLIFSINPESF